ncbi:alpha/beta fold hydrolase [Haematospirillum sp. H1815]|uniref:alpha/beta fold hydrolase n=1 Tax=Haematospirillum sp. H1815 TaxID=2723108 RepID=UPI001FD84ACD|nr:alpha/beta hydrolase [Haematospirillum sp. H1815]
MPEPQSGSTLCLRPEGFRRMAWVEWGRSEHPLVVCAHGLTRSGRDFDFLAHALASHYHVVCPDILGRGQSDWLVDPAGYAYPGYLSDMTTLISRFGSPPTLWIGTSMGGLIGMLMAALPGSPVQYLVMNDVGPFIDDASLESIRNYVGDTPLFPDYSAAKSLVLDRYADFGPIPESRQDHFVRYSLKSDPESGGFRFHYDPAIGLSLRATAGQDVGLWPVWESLTIPVLVLRGERSGLLSRETAHRMSMRPGTAVIEVKECGHAPSLMKEDQIDLLRSWISSIL